MGGSAISANTDDAVDDVDDWARQQLMIDGCDLLGKLYVPEVFFYTIQSLLIMPKQYFITMRLARYLTIITVMLSFAVSHFV